MPVRQAEKRIHPDDQAQRSSADFLSDGAKGVDHVGRSGPIQFTRVDSKAGLGILQGDFQHPKAPFRVGLRRRAVRRQTAGNETDLVQPGRFFDFQRRPQMAVMDGIEGAAVDADLRLFLDSVVRPMPDQSPHEPIDGIGWVLLPTQPVRRQRMADLRRLNGSTFKRVRLTRSAGGNQVECVHRRKRRISESSVLAPPDHACVVLMPISA